jgi:outer membrane protein OmpA-like peptidoglycan-associated protein
MLGASPRYHPNIEIVSAMIAAATRVIPDTSRGPRRRKTNLFFRILFGGFTSNRASGDLIVGYRPKIRIRAMIMKKSGRLALGTLGLSALLLSGCATEDYVNERVATVQSAVDALQAQVGANSGRIGALEGRVGQYDARFDKIEKGKFNYQKVSETALLFDTGKYTLKAEESAKLDALIDALKSQDQNAYIEVEGFADRRGGAKENRELGLRRAREVYNYIRDKGVALNRMMLFSQGEESQIGTGHDENRRVVVSVLQ